MTEWRNPDKNGVQAVRARPAIPRSVSSGEPCVAPRHGNGLTTGCRIAGAEAFELEGMYPSYIDIDDLRLRHADVNGPERVPVANKEYGRFELGR